MREIKITKELSGGRLDKMIYKYLDKAPSGFVYKMLRKKNIVLNDKKAFGSEILKEGDSIKIYLSEETINKFMTQGRAKTSEEKDLSASYEIKEYLVYEDENILLLNKPAGLLTQKAKPSDFSLNDVLLNYLGATETFTPGVANRLDRNTAGLVIAGKNLLSSRLLNKAIKDRDLKKFYLALVYGNFKEEKNFSSYLIKDNKSNTVKIFDVPSGTEIPKGAEPVEIFCSPLSYNGSLSLIETELITGKTHQIRAQLSKAGFPIIGDYKYGNARGNEGFKAKYGLSSQFLMAYKIEFECMKDELSYLNGKAVTAPLPENFAAVLKGEGLWQPGLQEA